MPGLEINTPTHSPRSDFSQQIPHLWSGWDAQGLARLAETCKKVHEHIEITDDVWRGVVHKVCEVDLCSSTPNLAAYFPPSCGDTLPHKMLMQALSLKERIVLEPGLERKLNVRQQNLLRGLDAFRESRNVFVASEMPNLDWLPWVFAVGSSVSAAFAVGGSLLSLYSIGRAAQLLMQSHLPAGTLASLAGAAMLLVYCQHRLSNQTVRSAVTAWQEVAESADSRRQWLALQERVALASALQKSQPQGIAPLRETAAQDRSS